MNTRTVRTVNKRPESSKKKGAAGPETLSLFRQPFLMADSIRRGLFVYNGYSFITISTPSSSQFTGVIPSNLTSSRFEK